MSKARFNPYQNNGGTVAAVVVGGKVAVGADTRISQGFNILSRNYCKMTELTQRVVIATAGMVTDAQNLHKLLQARVSLYKYQHGEEPSLRSLARLLCTTLYSRRFFPFYTFNLLAGIDSDGKGLVFGYDAIGSFDEMQFGVQGTGQELLMPVLDNQMKGQNRTDGRTFEGEPAELLVDVFNSCAERDIYTGDQLMIWEITAAGVTERPSVQLRAD